MTQAQVVEHLGVSERAVNAWRWRFRRGGWKALEKRPRGRSSAADVLTAAHQQRIVQAIRSHHPDQLRIPGLLWTRSAVQALIERECQVRLEVTTVGSYLRRWGFTLKRPVKRMLATDPVVVEAWLEEVYPAIKARAKRQGALILWQDESGVRLQQLTPKAGYAPRGVRAVAKVSGKYISTNMISALSNAGHLICDNHSTHHAKEPKAWVAAHAQRIELVFLPAYSPRLNPDEYLNQDVNVQPEIVRNYFNAPDVQHAR